MERVRKEGMRETLFRVRECERGEERMVRQGGRIRGSRRPFFWIRGSYWSLSSDLSFAIKSLGPTTDKYKEYKICTHHLFTYIGTHTHTPHAHARAHTYTQLHAHSQSFRRTICAFYARACVP